MFTFLHLSDIWYPVSRYLLDLFPDVFDKYLNSCFQDLLFYFEEDFFASFTWWGLNEQLHCNHIINNENIINNDPREIVPDHCNMSDQLILDLPVGLSVLNYSPLLAFLYSMDTSSTLSMGRPWPRPGKESVGLNLTRAELYN